MNEHLLPGFPHFVLSGDFQPDAITSKLGIHPTKSHRKGDVLAGTDRVPSVSHWVLACGDSDAVCDVQDQVVFLLSQLDPCKVEVAALCGKYRGELNLYACLDGSIPGFWLEASYVRKLAELNVNLECHYIRYADSDGEVRIDVN